MRSAEFRRPCCRNRCRLLRLSRCPEPYRQGMWDKAPLPPRSRVAIPNGQDSLPSRRVGSMDRYASPWCENPSPPRLHLPLPADALPKPSQRLGLGPRDKARWLPAHCPTRGQPGPPLHAPGLRLGRTSILGLSSRSCPSGSALSSWMGRRSGRGRMGSQTSTSCIPVLTMTRFSCYGFDLLQLDNEDYRQHPLDHRKAKLEKILSRTQGIRFSEHLDGMGIARAFTALSKQILVWSDTVAGRWASCLFVYVEPQPIARGESPFHYNFEERGSAPRVVCKPSEN
jgi:hypothetical protein